MDALDFEGAEFADKDTPESILMGNLDEKRIADALDKLSEVQRRRLLMHVYKGDRPCGRRKAHACFKVGWEGKKNF